MILKSFSMTLSNNLAATLKKLKNISQIEQDNRKILKRKYIKLESKWLLSSKDSLMILKKK